MKAAFVYFLIAAGALTVGTTGGIVVKRLSGEVVEYEGFNSDSLELDSEQTLNRYGSYKGNNVEKDFTAAELITVGLEKYRRCENSYSYGIGTANTIVSQSIRNFQIKNGDDYFEESISKSSFVSLADRMTQHGKDGQISLYHGSAANEETGEYTDNARVFEQQDYVDYLGKTLDKMFIYIISNVTVTDSEINKDNSEYKINVSLNPDFATYHYKYQMLNISGLDELPSFEYVNLKFTFTEDMMLKHLSVDEKYSAKMGFKVSITNNIEYSYFPNQYMKIPSLNEKLNYSLGGK